MYCANCGSVKENGVCPKCGPVLEQPMAYTPPVNNEVLISPDPVVSNEVQLVSNEPVPPAPGVPTEPKKKSNKLLLIVLGLVIIGVLGFVGYQFLFNGKKDPNPAKDKPKLAFYVLDIKVADFIEKHKLTEYKPCMSNLDEVSEVQQADYKKYEFTCKTEKCEFTSLACDYLGILEDDGSEYVYQIDTGEMIYAVPNGKQLTGFIAKHDFHDFKGTVALNLNDNDIYHLAKKAITYTSSDISIRVEDQGYIVFGSTIIISTGKGDDVKYGALNIEDGKIIVAPEYGLYSINNCEDWAGRCSKYSGVMLFSKEHLRNVNVEPFPYYSPENPVKYFAFEADTGKALFKGESYKYIVATTGGEGRAIIIENDNFKLIDFDNNLIKELGEAPKNINSFFPCKNDIADFCIRTIDKDDKTLRFGYNFTTTVFNKIES